MGWDDRRRGHRSRHGGSEWNHLQLVGRDQRHAALVAVDEFAANPSDKRNHLQSAVTAVRRERGRVLIAGSTLLICDDDAKRQRSESGLPICVQLDE